MPKAQAVWGIDIGQCGVKALRCVAGEEEGTVIADAFDFIEYTKVLSQPEANPAEEIAEALRQFLSRNSVAGDKVAISVPGQMGLSRFIKLPPVETKKIPDIVKYEARQQIPFDLADVIWDYQKMLGGAEAEGYALDTEVGLFAMKREQVAKALKPFDDAEIEVDVVQLAPLSICNLVAFDQLDLPDADLFDPENPPASVLVMSLGTDTSDLVITNGFRIWQRNIPIGGSHFTKALAKEMKQTFAKAEHIKRNAAQAENPKALFQAMRPVFNDLMTEVQRSINFFSNIDKKAKIKGALALGNTAKLPGLVRFLSQNLKLNVDRLESFRTLRGGAVVDAPAFKDNVLTFAVAYGLCLQVLQDTRIKTNLVLPEVVKERLIRSKKPWAVGAAAVLMLGLAIWFIGPTRILLSAYPDDYKEVEEKSTSFVGTVNSWTSDFQKTVMDHKKIHEVGDHLIYSIDKRKRWLQLWEAVQVCLPREKFEGFIPEKKSMENRIYITSMTSQEVPDLKAWYAAVLSGKDPLAGGIDDGGGQGGGAGPPSGGRAGGGSMGAMQGGAAGAPGDGAAPSTIKLPDDAPTGKGWVITLKGYHYHNNRELPDEMGANYVQRTLVEALKREQVVLPPKPNETEPQIVKIKNLGITHPVAIRPGNIDWNNMELNPDWDEKKSAGKAEKFIVQPIYPAKSEGYFTVQFAWRPDLPQTQPAGQTGTNQVAAANSR